MSADPATAERGRAEAALQGFARACRLAPEVDRATLREIVADNAGTEFGRAHGFGRLLGDLGAWARAVPLRRPDEFAPAIARMAGSEADVLVAGPVRFFARTSGTTGAGRLIPAPPRHLATFTRCYAGLVPAVPTLAVPGGDDPHRGAALISAAGTQQRTAAGFPIGLASTGGLRWARRLAELLWTSPWPVLAVEDAATQAYLHALFALRERSLKFIWAVFAPHLVEWLRTLAVRREALIRDLADGGLGRDLALTTAERAALAPRLAPDPDRAREVAAAFAADGPAYARRLWPRLRYAAAVISGGFAAYVPRLRRALGDLPIHTTCYAASEAVVGVNLEIDRPERHVLTPGTAHFEFIPLEVADRAQPETVGLEELVDGAHYEVVVTNRGGLYRYRLGDVVRVEGRHSRAPVLAFAWRQGTVLDLVGEHTNEAQMLAALVEATAAVADRGDALVDFAVDGDVAGEPPHYEVFVELAAAVDAGALARALDAALAAHNPLFAAYRRDERLGPPALRLLPAGSFRALAEQRSVGEGAAWAAQRKPVRRVVDPATRAWLAARARVT